MKKTKNRTTRIFFYKLCVTLQIYLELYNAKWIMKFKPQQVKILSQQWHWNYTKTVSQLIVINFVKSLPEPYFYRQNYTLDVFHLSFFLYLEFCCTSFFYYFITL